MTTSKSSPAVKRMSLDAKAKQRRDAMPAEIPMELFGVEFTLPPIKRLPMDAQERVGNNDVAVFRMVLGDEKVEEMIKAGYEVGDLELILEEWQEYSGVEPGESRASSDS
jgi:hypothetical protein